MDFIGSPDPCYVLKIFGFAPPLRYYVGSERLSTLL